MDMAIYLVKNNTFNGMPLPDIAVMHEDGSVRLSDISDTKTLRAGFLISAGLSKKMTWKLQERQNKISPEI